ncbi:MAG: PDR/VanB family oxidoreductase [Gemmataceae bacterium]
MQQTVEVEVAEINQVTPLIKQFRFQPTYINTLPPFSGGSHIIVILQTPDREFRNPYSLISSPRNLSHYEIAVRRKEDGRGGSVFLHDQLNVGSRLRVTSPLNFFPLVKLARKHLFVAGGVGITPFLTMIDDLRGTEVMWELHYATRSIEDAYYGLRLREKHGQRVHLYYDDAGHRINFLHILADQPLGTHVYTCGPLGMMNAVRREATAVGWSNSHIHSEEFKAPTVGVPFDAYLSKSKKLINVPSELSLLESIETAGVSVPNLCRGGVCGKCETNVLEVDGQLVHNDHWLTEAQKASGKKLMCCVSRLEGARLVLDI